MSRKLLPDRLTTTMAYTRKVAGNSPIVVEAFDALEYEISHAFGMPPKNARERRSVDTDAQEDRVVGVVRRLGTATAQDVASEIGVSVSTAQSSLNGAVVAGRLNRKRAPRKPYTYCCVPPSPPSVAPRKE